MASKQRKCSQQVASVPRDPRSTFRRHSAALVPLWSTSLRLIVLSLLVLIMGSYVFSRPGAVTLKEQKETRAIPELQVRKQILLQEQSKGPGTIQAVGRDLFSHSLTCGEAMGYSLRLFIPVVELLSGARWLPSPDKSMPVVPLSVEAYASLHRLAGAILVPLGIAALTGLLLRRDKT
jgi:hypothetical protein